MLDFLKKLWRHTKTFFFTVGLICVSLGFILTQTTGFGEEKFIQFWPTVGIWVTYTRAFGYLLIGMGLLFWMAIIGSLAVSSEES